jgi:hypothetical protein
MKLLLMLLYVLEAITGWLHTLYSLTKISRQLPVIPPDLN